MKLRVFSILISCLLLTASCGKLNSTPALEEGRVVSGMLWDRPAGSGSRNGNPIPEGTKVRLYPNFVVLITDDGIKHIVTMDYITNLKIK